ncbi:hypothetical protein M407DRAFT_102861 [Tulasnella calospora MUT 4182]|uniref:Peptidase C14 caspase domain-containing protein n=1 Tax=Tulasnella calospora MUT 4182 TaxID=1051891 RepID=A0A0C3Q559_9AGAM|nr:hypothetical protein M407DRAFT_102861 [Tulasnella calospora MUT 4182]
MLDAITRLFKVVPKGSARPDLTNTTDYAPLTAAWIRRHWRTFNLRSGHANIFIIICLCYEGDEWPEGGSMTLEGPREDLLLFLQHVRYRHQNEDRQFLIFTDFQIDFKDHTGTSSRLPTIPATYRDIETRVQGTMRDLGREDKCLLYYSGHLELDSSPVGDGSAYMVLRKDEKIHDHTLCEWLRLSRFSTTTITAIFDACHSGGFLGLPYVHERDDTRMTRSKAPLGLQMKSQVIEISSTAKSQLSFSERFRENEEDSGTTHGVLTWNVLQFLKVNPRPNLRELVSHIYRKCDTLWADENGIESHQVPVLSSSRRISGRISLF